MLFAPLASLLVPLFDWLFRYSSVGVDTPQELNSNLLKFELRHLHATSANDSAHVIFSDVTSQKFVSSRTLASDASGSTKSTYNIPIRRITTYKPSSIEAYSQARSNSLRFGQSTALDWDIEDIPGPDVEKREALLELAKMTNNAYLDPDENGWYDIGSWNSSYRFGWEPDDDGFRGHVFATPDNSTIVISIKGTSAGLFGRGGPTAKKDKVNDNLLFSCCCARIDWSWTTVCDCYRGGWKCDISCVQTALIEDSLFYPIGTNLYNNLTYMYPQSNVWIIGHSLGGSLASLVGITFGLPVVTFEAPGERMAATRLHLPSPPSTHHVTHIYHTADPIAMGICNGILSSCALAGYAMESKCHLGKSIIYDTVSNSSWSVDARTHGIVTVIEKVLSDPWPPSQEIGREVPEAASEDDCVECYSWEFEDG